MRDFISEHRSEAQAVGAAVGMAVLCVGSYAYGVLERGQMLDLLSVVVFAYVGLFNGWFMFAVLGHRRPDRGEDSDGGWGGFFGGR